MFGQQLHHGEEYLLINGVYSPSSITIFVLFSLCGSASNWTMNISLSSPRCTFLQNILCPWDTRYNYGVMSDSALYKSNQQYFGVTGKLAWSRQLYRHIQEPMDAFEQHPSIPSNTDVKKIVKNYNKLAKVLLEFEVLYHRARIRQVRHHAIC